MPDMTCPVSYTHLDVYKRQVQDWPAAGAAMNRIRILVAINLALGALTIAVATLGTHLGR